MIVSKGGHPSGPPHPSAFNLVTCTSLNCNHSAPVLSRGWGGLAFYDYVINEIDQVAVFTVFHLSWLQGPPLCNQAVHALASHGSNPLPPIPEYEDIGLGYQEDSFIDNSECFDELVPEELTTARGGFYINTGSLMCKTNNNAIFEQSSDFSSAAKKKPKKEVKKKVR